MKDCIFCNFDNLNILATNNLFFVKMDDNPVSPGHALIIPKKHLISFFDMETDELNNLFELIKETKKILNEKFKPDGYNIGVNQGKAAGQTLEHLHIHLIPRYKDDVENPIGGVRNIIPGKGDYTEE